MLIIDKMYDYVCKKTALEVAHSSVMGDLLKGCEFTIEQDFVLVLYYDYILRRAIFEDSQNRKGLIFTMRYQYDGIGLDFADGTNTRDLLIDFLDLYEIEIIFHSDHMELITHYPNKDTVKKVV